MELTPDLLLEAKFASSRRGYDMAEVDDFLERCAEGLDVLLGRLKSEYERAERAEAALADRPTTAPPAVAPTPEPESEPEPQPTPQPAAPAPSVDMDEPLRVLVMAERTAEAAISEAQAEANKIRSEAEAVANRQRSEAERLLTTARADAEAEARRASESARREIEQELNGLRRDRDGLNEDVRSLNRWLDEQRGRMRTAVREMNRLIDDPTALRELPVPDLTGNAGNPESRSPDQAVSDELWEAAGADEDADPGGGEPTRAVPAIDLGDDDGPENPTTGPEEVNF